MKRKMLSLLLAAFFGAALGTYAQRGNAPRRGGMPSPACQAESLAKRLKLDDAATAWFVPVYTEYRDTLRALRRSLCPKGSLKNLSDAQVLERLENSFLLAEREVALKRSYMARFRARLTPRQLLTVFAAPSPMRGPNMKPKAGRHHGDCDHRPCGARCGSR